MLRQGWRAAALRLPARGTGTAAGGGGGAKSARSKAGRRARSAATPRAAEKAGPEARPVMTAASLPDGYGLKAMGERSPLVMYCPVCIPPAVDRAEGLGPRALEAAIAAIGGSEHHEAYHITATGESDWPEQLKELQKRLAAAAPERRIKFTHRGTAGKIRAASSGEALSREMASLAAHVFAPLAGLGNSKEGFAIVVVPSDTDEAFFDFRDLLGATDGAQLGAPLSRILLVSVGEILDARIAFRSADLYLPLDESGAPRIPQGHLCVPAAAQPAQPAQAAAVSEAAAGGERGACATVRLSPPPEPLQMVLWRSLSYAISLNGVLRSNALESMLAMHACAEHGNLRRAAEFYARSLCGRGDVHALLALFPELFAVGNKVEAPGDDLLSPTARLLVTVEERMQGRVRGAAAHAGGAEEEDGSNPLVHAATRVFQRYADHSTEAYQSSSKPAAALVGDGVNPPEEVADVALSIREGAAFQPFGATLGGAIVAALQAPPPAAEPLDRRDAARAAQRELIGRALQEMGGAGEGAPGAKEAPPGDKAGGKGGPNSGEAGAPRGDAPKDAPGKGRAQRRGAPAAGEADGAGEEVAGPGREAEDARARELLRDHSRAELAARAQKLHGIRGRTLSKSRLAQAIAGAEASAAAAAAAAAAGGGHLGREHGDLVLFLMRIASLTKKKRADVLDLRERLGAPEPASKGGRATLLEVARSVAFAELRLGLLSRGASGRRLKAIKAYPEGAAAAAAAAQDVALPPRSALERKVWTLLGRPRGDLERLAGARAGDAKGAAKASNAELALRHVLQDADAAADLRDSVWAKRIPRIAADRRATAEGAEQEAAGGAPRVPEEAA